MKTKLISMVLMTAFLCLALVSASDYSVSVSDDLSKTKNSITLTFTTTNVAPITIIVPNPSAFTDGTNTLPIALSANTVTIDALNPATLTASYSGTLNPKFAYGDFTTKISSYINTTPDTKKETELTFVNDFCDDGCINESLLDVDVEVENKEGFGEEDNEWYPLDKIEVTVKVENKHDDTIDDIVIEWCLYDVDEAECIMDDEEDNFRLKEDDDNEVVIELQVDPSDLNEDSENYEFYVKVYSDDSEYGEDKLCTDYSEPITIMREEFVLLSDITLSSDITPCQDSLEVTAQVWNIGDEDLEDVYVMIYNKALNINEKKVIGDLDAFEDADLSFSYLIPAGTKEGDYDLEFVVFDEDDDIFETDEEEEAKFTKKFTIEGNCGSSSGNGASTGANVRIMAEFDSETPIAIPGEELIVVATLINTGDEETTYDISVLGNTAWSELGGIEPKALTLKPGESGKVSIALSIDDDVKGDKDFTVRATYSGKTTNYTVKVDGIDSQTSSSNRIVEHLKANWFIYVIVLVNLILIIAIIAVVRRMVAPSTI